MPGPRYRDASLTVAQRVDDLVGAMTLREKVTQLGGVWITDLVSDDRLDAEKLSSRMGDGIGHVTRIGASTGLLPGGAAELMNGVQRFAVESTRLGIPVVVHEESVGGLCARGATVFPQAIGLAAGWDPGLVEQVADVIRAQMVAVGARHSLSPVLDVARDARWGRLEETYGEDPVLAGALGTAYVKGLQADLGDGVVATGKHFLAYGAADGGRNQGTVNMGPRELREVYAEPFAAAIRDGGLASIMNSYSSVDGLPCAGSAAILDELLRGELGFAGAVVADYFAVSMLMSHHHTAVDRADAAIQALSAGLDLELPALDCFAALEGAVASGRVDVALVDRAVRRVLALKFRLGLFESPYVDAAAAPAVYDTPEQRRLAHRAAVGATVLLTNRGVLPLAPDVGRLAVIGPGADDRRLLQGDYHYPAHLEMVFEGRGSDPEFLPEAGGAFAPGPYYTDHVTPLAGIRSVAPAGCEVITARGCGVSGHDRSGFDEAVAAARRSDVAVVVVAGRSGLRPMSTVGEGRDAAHLGLTGAQEELVAAVAATGTPVVTVVMSGRAHALGPVVEASAAVVQLWPPGEEGGAALAEVLFGRSDPGGRLPVSLPCAAGQEPVHNGYRWGGGRSMFDGDYSDAPAAPLFPFGHGLSYATFAYLDPAVRAGTTSDPVVVEVTVRNTGRRPGTEVVQLYVSDPVASVARPMRQLVGFARVELDAGASRRIRFTVDPSRLAFYDPSMSFVVEPGWLRFALGSSWTDLHHHLEVELTGPTAGFAQRAVVATRVELPD
ncbi:MAG TPA: glycoside hydrolase family 3 N-terminal domain-containing protein [Acidimicrobiales bacterium]|nr:glycoside hydrolase family 3 N-terminal domain-containing protein [Acidimicrobiales bacterium]